MWQSKTVEPSLREPTTASRVGSAAASVPTPPPSPPEDDGAEAPTEGTMRIVLVSGSGLLAADRGGTSDPYGVFKLGGKKRKSKVRAPT